MSAPERDKTEATLISNVYSRFSAVQAEMARQGIAKEGKNQQQGYAYRGIDQVQNTLAPILANHGLVIIPNVTDHAMVTRPTRNGGQQFHHTVTVEYVIVDSMGGMMGPWSARGECLDSSDKGLNKACTAAYKYWILTTLCVPLEGHDDADNSTPEVGGAIDTEELVLSNGQVNEILKKCVATQTNPDRFAEWLGSSTLITVPQSQYARAIDSLNKKLTKMEADKNEQK